MRILLDENLPEPLAAELTGHRVSTVPGIGWSAIDNGELLRAASTRFDVLLSMDRGLCHQQNLKGLDLRVLILRAPSNRIEDLKPLVGRILRTPETLRPGRPREIGGRARTWDEPTR